MRTASIIRATQSLLLVGSIASASCTGDSGPAGPGAEVVQVYRNGFFFPWNGSTPLPATGNGVTMVAQHSLTDNISTDPTVMMVTISGSGSDGCLGTISGCVVSFTAPGTAPDMALYYASGHLQFNIRLGATVTLDTLRLRGNSNGQYGTATLSTPSLSSSQFTHVSIPIASLFPPPAVGTTVSVPFAIYIHGTVVGSNVPSLYLNDIKWTRH